MCSPGRPTDALNDNCSTDQHILDHYRARGRTYTVLGHRPALGEGVRAGRPQQRAQTQGVTVLAFADRDDMAAVRKKPAKKK
jgi:hypothetical protein